VTVHVSAETLRQDGALDPDDPPEIEDGPVLAPDTVRRLACEAPIVALVESASGEPLAVGRKTRLISPGMRRALKQRDGGCRFPGCPDTRFVDAHHIEHWADGGETRLDNLVLLCRLCRARHKVHYADSRIMPRGSAGSVILQVDHALDAA
jgi:5-methylcytosine-specific restriction endonuclease McrA